MKKFRTQTYTKEYCYEVRCDICNKVIDTDRGLGEFEAVSIIAEKGEEYPKFCDAERITPDICYKCFVTKILPTIEGLMGKKCTREVIEW